MKKFLAILVIATSLVACNDSANSTDNKEDSIQKEADSLKDKVEEKSDTAQNRIQNQADSAKKVADSATHK